MSSELENDDLATYLSRGPDRSDRESQRLYMEAAGQGILDNWNFFARLAYFGYTQEGRGAFSFDFVGQDPDNPVLDGKYLTAERLEPIYDMATVQQFVPNYDPKRELIVCVRARNATHICFKLSTPKDCATPEELFISNPVTSADRAD